MPLAGTAAPILQLPGVRSGVFLVRGEPSVLIDCGMRWQSRNILRALRGAGVAPDQIGWIALTHWHIDHTGSLPPIARATGAHIAAHHADAPFIEGATPPRKPDLHGEGGRFARWLLTKLYRPTNVDEPLNDGDVLPELGLQVVATPGHTPGHVCYYLPAERALFAGDALANRRGELSLPPAAFSDDPAQARASLERLRELAIEQCYFGHGEPLLTDAGAQIRAFLDQAPFGGSSQHG